MRIWLALYRWLLRLYPRAFREEFADEMCAVFTEAACEAVSHGGVSFARLCWREMSGLLSSIAAEYWHSIRRQGARAPMSDTIPLPNSGLRPAPGSWTDAVLAGLPHLLVVILAALPLGTVQSGTTAYSVFLFILPFFILPALVVAWRRGWPRWAASWYVYAGIIVILLPQIALFAVPLLIAGWLYRVAQRDQIKGLLFATPLMLLFWSPVLEFVRPTLHNSIQLGMIALAGAVAIAIVRSNNVRLGLWLALDASLLTGLLAAYARTYWHDLPPEYSAPASLAALAGLFAPQLVMGSALVIGPLLFWALREIGKRSGRAGRLGYRLALGGLMLNLFGILGYYWQALSIIGPGQQWFNVIIYLGLLLCLAGVLWLAVAARRNKVLLDRVSLALLVLIPSALPLMWMLLLPIWFGFRILPAGLSVALYDLGDIYKYEVYAVGLVWLLLGGWLVTRLHPRQRETA
jgi:hypothetical protein